jgi:oxygen-independent coproporphyrinogen-3 oxidase
LEIALKARHSKAQGWRLRSSRSPGLGANEKGAFGAEIFLIAITLLQATAGAFYRNRRNGLSKLTPGIYFHIPFCRAKCSYCHFVSVPFDAELEGRYHNAVVEELTRCADSMTANREVDSIYFGGGTPGLIPADHIAELLSICRRSLHVAENCEVSLEANPDTLLTGSVIVYRRSGVNRISVGAQSFHDQELSSLGRLHTAGTIMDAVTRLQNCGFRNINLDLMLGLPDQTATSWRDNLRKAVRLEVPHLSVYMLDLDDQCPICALVGCGSIQLPDEDLVSDLYLETIDFLAQHGYGQYEISNFALPGYTCRHNMKYWQRNPVYGIGAASHSFDGQSRYCNYSQIETYIEAVRAGGSPVNWRENMSEERSLSESLFLGLRLVQGVDWDGLQAKYGRDRVAVYEPGIRQFAHKGLVQWSGSTVSLTPPGMLVSNEIFQLFI